MRYCPPAPSKLQGLQQSRGLLREVGVGSKGWSRREEAPLNSEECVKEKCFPSEQEEGAFVALQKRAMSLPSHRTHCIIH